MRSVSLVDDRNLSKLAAVAFLALQALLYPPAIGIIDETAYLAQVYVFRHGTVFADVARISMWQGQAVGAHVASAYPPAESVLLLLPTIVDWRLVFAVNILLMVGGFFLFRALLGQLGLRREWGYLYLFYPPLVFYVRSVMTEVPSATLTVAALLLYARGGRRLFFAGALLGLAALFRYTNLVTLVVLLGCALATDLGWRRGRSASAGRHRSLLLLSGAAPGLAGYAVYNLFVFGQLFPPQYGSVSDFAVQFLPAHLVYYLVILLVVYPLMLVAVIRYRGPLRLEVLGVCVVALLVLSSYFWVEGSNEPLRNFVTGARLLLPFVPFYLVAYAAALDHRLGKLGPRRMSLLAALLVSLGLVVALAESAQNQQHLVDNARVREQVNAAVSASDCVLVTGNAPLFYNPAWGGPRWHLFAPDDPLASTYTCNGQRPNEIVLISQSATDDDLARTQALADRLHASRTLDIRSAWTARVWLVP